MKSFITHIFSAYSESKVRVFSAYAGFYIIVSAIPFLAVLFFVLSSLSPDLSYELEELLSLALPSGLSDELYRVMESIKTSPLSAFVPFSVITALWGSTKGVGGICFGIKRSFGKADTGSLVLRSVKTIWRTLIFYFLIISTLLVFALGRLIFAYTQRHHIILNIISEVLINLRIVIFSVALSLFFALLYSRLNEDKGFLKYLPAGIFSSLGWIIFTYFYSIYISCKYLSDRLLLKSF